MIDLNKTYKTRNGCEVVLHDIVLKNSAGGEVSYPVKGTVVTRKNPRKTTMMIWSIDGITDIVWGKRQGWDLVEDVSEENS
jgi:hypothetical protein